MEYLWSHYLPVLANFLAVILILVLATRKAMASFFVARAETVKNEVNEAETLYSTASRDLKEWEKKARSSEAYSQQMFAEAKATLDRQKSTTLDRAKTEAERVRKEVGIIAQSEAEKLKASLGREVVHNSVAAARSYLGGHLSDEDQQKLVTEYSEMVGNGGTR